MPAYDATLAAFARALEKDATAPEMLTAPLYPLRAGLAAYGHNLQANRHQALAGAYPVITQVVGPDYFEHLALRYGQQQPSTSGNLHDYGENFSEFLAEEGPASLPYLADLATLEWACHRAYFAEDENPLDLQRLANLDAETVEQLVFQFHPATALVHALEESAHRWLAQLKAGTRWGTPPATPSPTTLISTPRPCCCALHNRGSSPASPRRKSHESNAGPPPGLFHGRPLAGSPGPRLRPGIANLLLGATPGRLADPERGKWSVDAWVQHKCG